MFKQVSILFLAMLPEQIPPVLLTPFLAALPESVIQQDHQILSLEGMPATITSQVTIIRM